MAIGAIMVVGCTAPQAPGQAGASQGQAPAGSKRLRAAVLAAPPGFYLPDQAFIGTAGVQVMEKMVNSSLTVPDPRDTLTPLLADAVPTLENGRWVIRTNGKAETTWTIRAGVTWHDGTPLTSEDLLFTMMVKRDPEVGLSQSRTYTYIESIEAPDLRTVKVVWNQPYIQADRLFTDSQAPWPKHLLERAYQQEKTTLLALPYWNVDFVGTGPFKLRDWVTGSHLVVVANNAYVLGRPKIDEIEVRLFGDPSVLFANILGGGADLGLGKAITFEQGLDAQRSWNEGRVNFTPSSAVRIKAQFLYPGNPVVLELPFRRAVSHGIHRQEIVDTLMAGRAPAAEDHLLSPGDPPAYEPVRAKIVRYPYDPRRAMQLIEGLGYTRGSDGLFRDSGGQVLRTGFRTNTVDLNQKTLLAVVDQLRKVGIEVEPEFYTLQQGSDLEYRAKFSGFELLRSGSLSEVDQFHSREQKTPATNWRGNQSGYSNPEYDALVDRYLVTIPMPERVSLLGDLLHILSDQVVEIPIFWDVDATMVGNRVGNFSVSQRSWAWNLHEWEVRG